MNWPVNGTGIRKAKKAMKKHGFDESHFKDRYKLNRKYKSVTKKCPVCLDLFETKKGHKNEKTTCSHACSNTYFRTGRKNGKWKSDAEVKYTTLCWRYHEKKCIVCGEDKIVAVHHYDENHENNEVSNLIPLCPTHHIYYHSRYRTEIQKQVDEYRLAFIKKHTG